MSEDLNLPEINTQSLDSNLNNNFSTLEDAVNKVSLDLSAFEKATQSILSFKANDSEVSHLAGAETITGDKTFLGTTTIGLSTGILKRTSGVVENAVDGADYLSPSGDGSNLTGIGKCILDVSQSMPQAVGTSANTLISLDTVNTDLYNAFNSTPANYKYVIPESLNGRSLLIISNVGFVTNGAGARVIETWYNNSLIYAPVSFSPSSTNNSTGQDVKIISGSTGDYIQLYGYQSSGGNLSTFASYCRMKIYLL